MMLHIVLEGTTSPNPPPSGTGFVYLVIGG